MEKKKIYIIAIAVLAVLVCAGIFMCHKVDTDPASNKIDNPKKDGEEGLDVEESGDGDSVDFSELFGDEEEDKAPVEVTGKVDETVEDLKEKLPLTKEEEKKVDEGAELKAWPEYKDISATVSDKEKTLVKDACGDDWKVGVYLDVSFLQQVGDAASEKVTKLDKEVTITVTVPEKLINKDSNVTRTYKIVRVHDGKAQLLDTVYDAAKQELSFKTDRFSTYAIVYFDEVIETPGNGDGGNENETPGDGDGGNGNETEGDRLKPDETEDTGGYGALIG